MARRIKAFHGAGILFYAIEGEQLFVLLGKRTTRPGKGTWSIPGGSWDRSDGRGVGRRRRNYRNAAIREASEQVYYLIKDRQQAHRVWRIWIPFFTYVVYSYRLSERVVFSHNWEFGEVGWFETRELPQNGALFVRGQVRALSKSIQRERDGN